MSTLEMLALILKKIEEVEKKLDKLLDDGK